MSRQDKIDKIYEVVARKDLSFGCEIFSQAYNKNMIITEVFDECWDVIYKEWDNCFLRYLWYTGSVNVRDAVFVIWHPAMMGDVLDWVRSEDIKIPDEDIFYIPENRLLRLRTKRREPIENQSDECIEYIYNLILDKCQ